MKGKRYKSKMMIIGSCLAAVLFIVPFAAGLDTENMKKDKECEGEVIYNKAPLDEVEARLKKLVPITIAPDYSYLPANEQKVIQYLVKASHFIEMAFMRQAGKDNLQMFSELKRYVNTPEQPYYDLFKVMLGPWDRLDNNAPFINLETPKPLGAGFYPDDLTKEAFDDYILAHPEAKDQLTGLFTMVRRHKDRLVAIPYSSYFQFELSNAAKYMRKAAELTSDNTLRTYLLSRIEAFFTNDYRQSDIDWIGLKGDVELVIGPYEVYEDELFGYKAAFESFVCLVDRLESEKLKFIESYRSDMTNNYPIPDPSVLAPQGLSSPIKVVNEVFGSGDARRGIPFVAFNLPNDEWVRKNVGSKNVMLKNMLQAKYDGVLVPIKERVIAPKDKDKPTFEGFFNYVLMHEISHGLAPGEITVNGQKTTVRKELKELFSTIEECQADTLSIYNNEFLLGLPDSPMPKELSDSLYASYLSSMFRAIRFGLNTAHGGAITIQLNYHIENNGFSVDENGQFQLNEENLKASVKSLATLLLTIELNGDYNGAKALIEKYRVVTPDIQNALDKLADVPVDVRKEYPFDN